MNIPNRVTCHLDERSNSVAQAFCDRGFEVGTAKFSQWALEKRKFQFKVHWQPFSYSVCYAITCHLRANQSWEALKCVYGVFKTHNLGKTEQLTTAKLIEAVQWLCPDPQSLPTVIPDEEEETKGESVDLSSSRKWYNQLTLELEELRQQLEEVGLENEQLKAENNQLFHQQLGMSEANQNLRAEQVKIRQEFDRILSQKMEENSQYQEQIQVIGQIVSELGDKLNTVNLKTNPRWYYANRYYKILREILEEESGKD